jgi:hypothetical protein
VEGPCHAFFLVVTKDGRSANKFRKSQIRKFEDLILKKDIRTFCKCSHFRISDFRTELLFAFIQIYRCLLAVGVASAEAFVIVAVGVP